MCKARSGSTHRPARQIYHKFVKWIKPRGYHHPSIAFLLGDHSGCTFFKESEEEMWTFAYVATSLYAYAYVQLDAQDTAGKFYAFPICKLFSNFRFPSHQAQLQPACRIQQTHLNQKVSRCIISMTRICQLLKPTLIACRSM